ncbi:MAG: TetR/AcrR family transcriptional regulator [Nannocystaceae bacterium]|nr:TetR/AcrR family transcriptional regulator [Nannocystaceae bacterium]
MPWSKNFDVDEALLRAEETFWSKGYDATSMRDLLAAMGIQKGSFYDTYGSKHEAFIAALRCYAKRSLGALGDMGSGLSPRQALAAMFEYITEDCTGPDRERGCMLINCALELAPRDPEAQKMVQKGFKRHEALMRTWIVEGQAIGEIEPDIDASAVAKAMLGLIMGMRVHARAGSGKATIKTLADQAMGLLGASRVTGPKD